MNWVEMLLEKAGVKTTHQNYIKKRDQLYALHLSDHDLEQLYSLDGRVLRYLYIGTLTINNREAFINGMATNMALAIRTLKLIDVLTLVSVLEKIEARLGTKDENPLSSKKWRELGLELALGIDEDPLILLRRYWEE